MKAHENNLRVDELRHAHDLTRQAIADICGCSKSWVDSWLSEPQSKYYRECPDNMLHLLEFELGLRMPTRTDMLSYAALVMDRASKAINAAG